MRVYREISEHQEECSFGLPHTVRVWAGKDIEETGATWQYDPGYGLRNVQTEKIYKDTQGREYYAMHPIDYAGRTSYILSTGGKKYHFFTRLLDGYNVDTLGRKI